ncbi:hypothetical protein [Methylobacterium variabile]|uniref:hypothetical protein n=1 Tax=Methylobacterium variabile TaxID=298794 RepID=UPI0012ECF41D|nr:hypothetical protein [Methylobacterium variabile]
MADRRKQWTFRRTSLAVTAMTATVAALLAKAGPDAGSRGAFLVQGAPGCLFTLRANRRAERLR